MRVNTDLCRGCKMCIRYCKFNAIEMRNGKAYINENCKGCKMCIEACSFEAIEWE